ncbi:hypothetical protein PVAP13_4KG185533 [Panicum virgatum]|uniref:Uncharacterized protein n=1 Tax=Panicum virgatum TaxID=38727 RepID=A0A8T0TF08_PANVG|nr:hypothetical protein PVAP13_4KG185533 [Panicum virgatum]
MADGKLAAGLAAATPPPGARGPGRRPCSRGRRSQGRRREAANLRQRRAPRRLGAAELPSFPLLPRPAHSPAALPPLCRFLLLDAGDGSSPSADRRRRPSSLSSSPSSSSTGRRWRRLLVGLAATWWSGPPHGKLEDGLDLCELELSWWHATFFGGRLAQDRGERAAEQRQQRPRLASDRHLQLRQPLAGAGLGGSNSSEHGREGRGGCGCRTREAVVDDSLAPWECRTAARPGQYRTAYRPPLRGFFMEKSTAVWRSVWVAVPTADSLTWWECLSASRQSLRVGNFCNRRSVSNSTSFDGK